MPLLNSLCTIAGEPASILYILTGAVGFVYAGIRRKSGSTPEDASTSMLFSRRESRALLKSLRLL
jgi:hypothetical protein